MKNLILFLIVVLFVIPAIAQEDVTTEDAEGLSKQAANPVADLMSFPFQNNLNMNKPMLEYPNLRHLV